VRKEKKTRASVSLSSHAQQREGQRMIVYALVSVEKNVLAEFAVEEIEFLTRLSCSSPSFSISCPSGRSRTSLGQLSHRHQSPLVENP
jgi:hypothetical protein